MRRFWFGFVVAVIALLAAEFVYVRLGFVDPRADVTENSIEKNVAMPALDASVDRRAPEMKNPISPTDENLIAGMRLYQTNCSSCHGDIQRPEGMFAEAFYPRAPQFVKDPPDMPENQNFYIIQHGVRLSGMPAWNRILTKQEIWQLTTFLSHMDTLSPQIATQWKHAATPGATGSTAK
jgi:mono/diheme cytochrome c family protein